jgi:hypothetical protein
VADERVVIQFPTTEAWQAAISVDSYRWVRQRGAEEAGRPGTLHPELLDACSRAIIVLTSNRPGTVDTVMAALVDVIRDIVAQKKQERMVAQILELMNDAAAEQCTNPDCPVHGKHMQGKQPGPNPDDLDTAFGVGEWKL